LTVRYYRNAKIFTGVDEVSFATAFAVEDGTFAWVGDVADIPRDAEVEDLDSKVVLPGLIDAHTHPTYISMTVDAVLCTVPLVHSIPEMIEALKKHPAYGKGDAVWIEGWGYDESKLAGGRTPTREDLDQVSTTQPVYVLRSDCHSGICNTRALEIASITKDTPDPEGAHFGREADGTPNGILQEHAANQAVMQAKGSAGYDAEVDSLVRTTEHLSARGIVACTDMLCIPLDFTQLDEYRAAEAKGFRQCARIFYHFESLKDHPIPPITDAERTGRVAVGGIKLFMDGSISNRTAWLRHPYRGRTDEVGMRTSSPELMAEALDFARDNHLQIACHAMGDRAIREVIDVYGDEEPWMGDIPSVRIEHASVLDAHLIQRMTDARVHFGVATNIDFFFAEYDSYSQNLTDDQFSRTYPVKDLYEHVHALALSSDCPATTWPDPDNPFMSIQAAVTRKAYNGADIVPNQAITVPQAVLLYTGRANKVGDMPRLGRIRPGYEASFITLTDDIFEVDPSSIIDLKVTGTWIQGARAYSLS
jgi:predicted amidohydrolase YtcJ